MIRAVFDANVLASGFVGLSRAGSGAPSQLLRLWMLGRFTLVVSEPILTEVEKSAFESAYFQRALPVEARRRVFDTLRRNAVITGLSIVVRGVAPDPDDDHVLAAALSSQAKYLVTGDQALRSIGSYNDLVLVTPREFLELIEIQAEAGREGSAS